MKRNKKGRIEIEEIAIIIVVILVVILLVMWLFPGLRDPLSTLTQFISGMTATFKTFRGTPDFVETQQESAEFQNRINRIINEIPSCDGYKEVQTIYSKAKVVDAKAEIPIYEVCTQNKQGTALDTDLKKYCERTPSARKEEVSYFKQYVECLTKGRDSTLETCQQAETEADKFLQSSGRYNAQSPYAKESPHDVYVEIGDCYFRIATQDSLKKAEIAYKKYQTYASTPGVVSNPATQSRVAEQTQKLEQQTNPQLWEAVKTQYDGDPTEDFNKALGQYQAKDFSTAIVSFNTLSRKIEKVTVDALILKQIQANSYYFYGASRRFAQPNPDAVEGCNFLDSIGTENLLDTDSPFRTQIFLSQTNHKGLIVPQALYDIATCYHQLPDPNNKQEDLYYTQLFATYPDEAITVKAAQDLAPKCSTVVDSVTDINHDERCEAVNEFARQLPITNKYRKELLCYYDPQGWFDNGVCKPCGDNVPQGTC